MNGPEAVKMETGAMLSASRQLEEALDGGVIIEIALAAYRYADPMLAKDRSVFVGAVLRATIGVVNTAR